MLRIDLEAVGAGGLRLLLAGGGEENSLALGRTEGVRGTCEIDGERVSLRDFVAESVGLERSTFQLPGGKATVALLAPGAVHRVALEGVLRVGRELALTGTGSIGTIALDGVRLSAAGVHAELRLSAGQARYWEDGGQRELDVATLTILELTASLPGVGLEAGRLELRDLRARISRQGVFHVECAKVTLKNVALRAHGVSVHVDNIELASGFTLTNSSLAVPELSLDNVQVEARSILSLASAGGRSRASSRGPLPDLPFLDLVDGHVHFDLGLDVAVPMVKKRAARYEARLDVERGVVDYHALEKGLSWLEDALIDFELEGDRLILELDPLPLVKFDNKTLVWWRLAGQDLELARRKRVRLRKLLEYRLDEDVAARAERSAGADSPLLKLDIDELDVELAMEGPSELALPGVHLRLGAEGVPALGSLRLAGALHYAAERQPQPTQLSAEVRGLALRAIQVSLALGDVSLGSLDLRAVERMSVAFQGITPGRVDLVVDHIVLGGLAGRLRAGALTA